jgi:anti-sigma-K factor RskA
MEFIAHAERVIPMHGTESDPDASGHAFVGDGGERVLLVVDRLDPLPAERVYQLWLTTDSEDMISAGTFTVGPDGEGRIWTDLSSMPAGWASMFITPEPKGGSEQPTSKPVCVWGRAL